MALLQDSWGCRASVLVVKIALEPGDPDERAVAPDVNAHTRTARQNTGPQALKRSAKPTQIRWKRPSLEELKLKTWMLEHSSDLKDERTHHKGGSGI